jgi:hypothetical protein
MINYSIFITISRRFWSKLYYIKHTCPFTVKGNMYEIGTDLGRLPKLCTREQFQICDQDTRSTDNSVFPLDEYCTYEVTKDYSVNTFACQCVKQCKNFRCMCKRMHIQCSSVCHNQSPCFNKTYCHSSLPPEDR